MKKVLTLTIIISFFCTLAPAQTVQDLQSLQREYEAALRRMESLESTAESVETQRPVMEIVSPQPGQTTRAGVERLGDLSYFGYDFFTTSAEVAMWENLPVAADYRLGPGDEVIISLWGETQRRSTYNIDRNGNIYIDDIGQLSLTGKRLEDARAFLNVRFEQVYSTLKNPNPTTFLDVTLGTLKFINVKFLGEVNQPGIYPIHPFSTVMTGLILVGGVKESGSLREIQVIRDGEVHTIVDLYAFLLQGKTDRDIRLQDQDVIVVPVRKSTIRIEGMVSRPAIYESIPGESFSQLLAYAGGFLPDAQDQLVVERIIPSQEREHDDNAIETFYIPYNELDEATVVDGDIIHIHEIHSVQLQISVRGQVKRPGAYVYQDSMRLMDALNLAGGINDESYWKSVYTNQAEVIRRREDAENPLTIPIDLNLLREGDESQNILLQNLDEVVIRQNPHFDPPKNITVKGEVAVPGAYSILSNNETLADIFRRAGGFTDLAFEDGIRMYRGENQARVVLQDYSIQVAAGDSVYVPEHPGVVQVIGEVYNPGLIHFREGKSLQQYVVSAGGYSRDADKRDISVVMPDGDVQLRRLIFDPKVREGSTIIVHEKEQSEPFDVTEFLAELTSILASLYTIIFIVSRG